MALHTCHAFSGTTRPTTRRVSSITQPLANSSSSRPESSSEPSPVKCPDCDLCDGSGRILGGIAVLLPWWPIKAYRPCPNFIAQGGFYERTGQGLDEIAFGRDATFEK